MNEYTVDVVMQVRVNISVPVPMMAKDEELARRYVKDLGAPEYDLKALVAADDYDIQEDVVLEVSNATEVTAFRNTWR